MEDPKFGTHKRFLKHYIMKTSGDIIEFGCGHSSTPLIRELIKGTDRKLYTYESDLVWLKQMEQLLPPTENHVYIHAPEWKNTLFNLSSKHSAPSVVFVDQSPWEARYKSFIEFKDKAEYIIIHDVDWFPKNGMFGRVNPSDEFDFDFNDISDNWALYYPEKPYPASSGPPTLVIGRSGCEIDKL